MTEFEIKNTNEDIELSLFIEAIEMKYGYNFKEYSRAHIKRRVKSRLIKSNMSGILELTRNVLYNEAFFREVLLDFSINVTEMFRDPEFFKFIKDEIFPILESYPEVKIWHAGCSSGEEVYSMAIMLKEYGIYDRCKIYATDFNENILKRAKDGIYSLESMKEYTKNYILAGGNSSFSDYYLAKYDSAIIDSDLKRNITFAEHNLVTDGVFGQMNLIMCRNVLIYFDKSLQNKVNQLFTESLIKSGFLCLGTKESLKYSSVINDYETIDETLRVYKKIFKI